MNKEQLLAKCNELGIISVSDANTVEELEICIRAIERFEEKYPDQLMITQIKFIEKHREEIWKLEKPYQEIFFRYTQDLMKALFDANWDYDRIFDFVDKLFDGKKYRQLIEN